MNLKITFVFFFKINKGTHFSLHRGMGEVWNETYLPTAGGQTTVTNLLAVDTRFEVGTRRGPNQKKPSKENGAPLIIEVDGIFY